MIGFENNQNAFFYIEPHLNIYEGKTTGILGLFERAANTMTNDVINFSVTEEMGKVRQGTLSILDNDNFYSGALKSGTSFNLIWGYRLSPFDSVATVANKATAEGGFAGLNSIRFMKCFVVSPSGAAQQDGQTVYNCTFYGQNIYDSKVNKVFENIPKTTMVQEIMTNQMGCNPTNVFIDWANGTQLISHDKPIRQKDRPFKFLVDLAKQERCLFDINYLPDGLTLGGYFVDSSKVDSPTLQQFVKSISGRFKGQRNILSFGRKSSLKNLTINIDNIHDVQSYSWSQNVGENGTGSNVRILYINGRVTFFRTVAGTQTVKTYQIDPDKIKQVLGTANRNNKLGAKSLQLLTSNFDQLLEERIIVETKSTTAPEGFGFRMTVQLGTGDPGITTPSRFYFLEGFPNSFISFSEKNPNIPKAGANTFYLQKVTHNISRAGYKQTLEIADTYTITGGSLIGAVGPFN